MVHRKVARSCVEQGPTVDVGGVGVDAVSGVDRVRWSTYNSDSEWQSERESAASSCDGDRVHDTSGQVLLVHNRLLRIATACYRGSFAPLRDAQFHAESFVGLDGEFHLLGKRVVRFNNDGDFAPIAKHEL